MEGKDRIEDYMEKIDTWQGKKFDYLGVKQLRKEQMTVKRNRSCVLVTLLVVVFAAILVAGCIARKNRDQRRRKG